MAILPSVPGIVVTIHDATDDDTPLKEYDALDLHVATPDKRDSDKSTLRGKCGSSSSGGERPNIDHTPSTAPRRQLRKRNTATAGKDIAGPGANADDRLVIKYIESVTDTPFRICWTYQPAILRGTSLLRDGKDVQARVYIDGKFIEDRLTTASELLGDGEGEWREFLAGQSRVVGGGGGRWVVYELVFQRLAIDASKECDAEEKEANKGLGSVRVEMFAGYIKKPARGDNEHWANVELPGKISEKSVKGKAVSHGVGLAREKAVRHLLVNEFTAAHDEPFAIFEFRYRSLEDLKKLGIVERTPELKDKPLEDLTREELIVLVRQYSETDEARKRTKREAPVNDNKNETKADLEDEVVLIKKIISNTITSKRDLATSTKSSCGKATGTSQGKDDADEDILVVEKNNRQAPASCTQAVPKAPDVPATADNPMEKDICPEGDIAHSSSALPTTQFASTKHITTEENITPETTTLRNKRAPAKKRLVTKKRPTSKGQSASAPQNPRRRQRRQNETVARDGQAAPSSGAPVSEPYFFSNPEDKEPYPVDPLLFMAQAGSSGDR